MADRIMERDRHLKSVAGADWSQNDAYDAEYGSGSGGSGGGGMERLEKRVDRIETDVTSIKIDMAKLNTRSEALATKSDIETLRTEMATGYETLRTEMVASNGNLRNDMTAGDGGLRTEMADGFGKLRAEMAEGFGNLRAEMAENQGKVNTEFEKLRTEQQAMCAALSEKIETASVTASKELSTFKGALFWQIGLPLFAALAGGFGLVVWALFKVVAASQHIAVPG